MSCLSRGHYLTSRCPILRGIPLHTKCSPTHCKRMSQMLATWLHYRLIVHFECEKGIHTMYIAMQHILSHVLYRNVCTLLHVHIALAWSHVCTYYHTVCNNRNTCTLHAYHMHITCMSHACHMHVTCTKGQSNGIVLFTPVLVANGL